MLVDWQKPSRRPRRSPLPFVAAALAAIALAQAATRLLF